MEYGTINPDGTVDGVTVYHTGYYGINIQEESGYYWLTESRYGSDQEYDHFPTPLEVIEFIDSL
jgi:hypothetical protein